MPQLRAPLPGEGAVLGALLDEAFAEHDEAQRFEPEVMALLLDGPRGGAQLSLVAEDAGRPVAVAFVGRRALRWGAKLELPGVMDLIEVADVTATLDRLLAARGKDARH